MAIFRSLLKTLISQSTKKPPFWDPSSSSPPPFRTFFSLSSAAQPLAHRRPYDIVRDPIFAASIHRNYFLRCCNVLSPLSLSSPPWKLSQSATPILLQCDVVLLELPKVRNALDIPYRLVFPPTPKNSEEEKKDGEFSGSRLAVATDDADSVVKVTDSYLNLPNYISFARLLSGPLLGWMINQEMYLPAFVGLGISGATDWLDGYLARKMGINSVVGSYLDPLADKVLIICVALGMVHKGLLYPGLVALVVLRDVALIGGVVYKRASNLNWQWKSWSDFFNLDATRPQKVEPLMISKINTVLQLVLIAAALLQPEFGNEETRSFIRYLSWLVALTTVSSTAAYGAQHLGTGSKLKCSL